MSFNPAFGWMQEGDPDSTASKSNASVTTKFTATTTDKASFTTTSEGATRSTNVPPGRRPSFHKKEGSSASARAKPPPPPSAPPPTEPASGFDFLSSQDKLQQDLTAMTLKNKSVRATTQARKNLAQKERMNQKRVIDEKVQSARKQLEEEDDQWLKFLMEQREREIREAQAACERQKKARETAKNKTPEQRQEEARQRRERDAERRAAASFESQSQSSVWREYEAKWTAFGALEVVTLANIPWPPSSEALLQWAVKQIPGGDQQDHKSKVKTAYKKCALRWHPDKFLGKYGAKVAGGEGEIEKIRGKLNDNFQSLNASFTRLRM